MEWVVRMSADCFFRALMADHSARLDFGSSPLCCANKRMLSHRCGARRGVMRVRAGLVQEDQLGVAHESYVIRKRDIRKMVINQKVGKSGYVHMPTDNRRFMPPEKARTGLFRTL